MLCGICRSDRAWLRCCVKPKSVSVSCSVHANVSVPMRPRCNSRGRGTTQTNPSASQTRQPWKVEGILWCVALLVGPVVHCCGIPWPVSVCVATLVGPIVRCCVKFQSRSVCSSAHTTKTAPMRPRRNCRGEGGGTQTDPSACQVQQQGMVGGIHLYVANLVGPVVHRCEIPPPLSVCVGTLAGPIVHRCVKPQSGCICNDVTIPVRPMRDSVGGGGRTQPNPFARQVHQQEKV